MATAPPSAATTCPERLAMWTPRASTPFDIEKSKKLLAEAGIKTPLELTLTLPPTPYARQGGEVIVAQLACGYRGQDAERGMGAVAQRHVWQQELRPR